MSQRKQNYQPTQQLREEDVFPAYVLEQQNPPAISKRLLDKLYGPDDLPEGVHVAFGRLPVTEEAVDLAIMYARHDLEWIRKHYPEKFKTK